MNTPATAALAVPTVPVSYVLLMLELAQERGISASRLLQGLNIPPDLLQEPDGRVSLRPDYAGMCRRALLLTQDPALGYEFGLRSSLTTHGIVGYGVMSQPSLRHVLTFANRFGAMLRLSAWDLHFYMADGFVCMRGIEAIAPNDLRLFSAQQLVISCYAILLNLFPDCRNHIVLTFGFPEPDYHARYARRLPQCQFGAAFNEVRMPMHYLDQPLKTANTLSVKLAERECVRELALMSHQPHEALVRNARALLVITPSGHLSLDAIADRLCVSPRTLTRQLSEHGTSYRALLQEAQRRDSRVLLSDLRLSVADVASRLGYSSLANFTRACRLWHGVSPSQWRAQARTGEASEKSASA